MVEFTELWSAERCEALLSDVAGLILLPSLQVALELGLAGDLTLPETFD